MSDPGYATAYVPGRVQQMRNGRWRWECPRCHTWIHSSEDVVRFVAIAHVDDCPEEA